MTEGTPAEPRSSFPAGARCALHPERLAERTCVRCGNYMCPECASSNAAGMCLACASREGAGGRFPYSRDNYTFDGLLNLALSRWKQNWLALALIYGATLLVTYGPPVVLGATAGVLSTLKGEHADQPLNALGQILGVILQFASQLVLFGCSLDVLEQIPLSFGRAMARLKALPHMLLQLLIIYGGIAVCAGLGFAAYSIVSRLATELAGFMAAGAVALAVVPVMIYVSLGIVFMLVELAHNPEANALSALRLSWTLAYRRRWSIAGVLFVSGLISGAGVLLCCVGLLASAPLGMLLYGALFLTLKQPTAANERAQAHEWPV